MIIQRQIGSEFKKLLDEYPVVTIIGPRQAGKTTLARYLLPDYTYISLENPENKNFATEDPIAFLKQYSNRVIFDEIQNTPHLLSYLQGIVDNKQQNGQFVLTGSNQLQLSSIISQSLAGRTAILKLLPLSISELSTAKIKFDSFEEYLFNGFLPAIYDKKQRANRAYANYYQTYVLRDIRLLINLKDISLFEKFLKLLAGRVGQIINYQSLGNDVGVSSKTIKHWLSVLEVSFIIFKLPPYFENFGKRAIKSPKYYFSDCGLLSYLLGINQSLQISRDPLVGNMFENLVILEILKFFYNQGLMGDLYFYRNSNNQEIDLLFKQDNNLVGVEIKSSSTWHNSFGKNLLNYSKNIKELDKKIIIYNGKKQDSINGIKAINFKEVADNL
ncbi:MAG: AAA family ATPase [Gammaproteobacteria bacterium]|nr:MAG: AAA family ATPase [Gammaproteobacteria bacterium]